MSRRTKKSVTVTVSPRVLAWLDAEAERQGTSRSGIVERLCIEEVVRNLPKRNGKAGE